MKASAASHSLSTKEQTSDKKNTQTSSTIDHHQATHFGKMAKDWWNPFGSSAMLHRMNPVRLSYIRQAIDQYFVTAFGNPFPLMGKKVLDIGCGAGLLSEPLSRLGGDVTGVDAASENVAVAKAHAEQQHLKINYMAGDLETVEDSHFDLITAMEVLEHVADPAEFIQAIAAKLDQNGLLILSTPNRTLLSRMMIIGIGETLGGIPAKTHDWSRFLKPEETKVLLEKAGLVMTDIIGMTWTPLRGFSLSHNKAVDYLMTIQKKS
ncbi:MAG: bifunctional 2-polyprenyl-6-hydroxyphenol methylase/3-demethylubiquinol 3-O-methyltransferase UbiG [Zymomonas mobilis]|uniref:Ubiquinone biosynthesis O-methyltransferase n=1 Tax=Zymomonas mobilis TaxID=542 RepID=A0A542W308_ZYMMB|nr:bifunctional 2-polyprenyl-6-hydroxyphenol methylase/3-demethylubiquinol 3-O-methyltransferase UbiG [Zymomonas mobilis]TQL17957.1 3-demethylubiquinone-9 3-methyltransferase [Zymomonas mobilis]